MDTQESQEVKNLTPKWMTVKLLAQYEPAFTCSAIRNLIFQSEDRKTSLGVVKGNGLAPAIRRVGSKVLINHEAFLTWIDAMGNNDFPDSKPSAR